ARQPRLFGLAQAQNRPTQNGICHPDRSERSERSGGTCISTAVATELGAPLKRFLLEWEHKNLSFVSGHGFSRAAKRIKMNGALALADPPMPNTILVVAEQRENKLNRVSLETIAAARQISNDTRWQVEAVLPGSNVAPLASELAQSGLARVYALEAPSLAAYTSDAYVEALKHF